MQMSREPETTQLCHAIALAQSLAQFLLLPPHAAYLCIYRYYDATAVHNLLTSDPSDPLSFDSAA